VVSVLSDVNSVFAGFRGERLRDKLLSFLRVVSGIYIGV
jgi:hypothetical protein